MNLTPKILSGKIHIFCVNNQPNITCKANIILFPKTNFERLKLIKVLKNEISNVWEKFSYTIYCIF